MAAKKSSTNKGGHKRAAAGDQMAMPLPLGDPAPASASAPAPAPASAPAAARVTQGPIDVDGTDGPQGALAAGGAAFGMARKRAGFGKTPVDDVLFALGYPQVPLLDNSDVKAPSGVVACGRLIAGLVDAEIMARAGALRLVRGADLGTQLQVFVDQWEQNGAALSDDEVDKLLDGAFHSYDGQRTVRCLEALTSSERVLLRLTSALEALPLAEWHDEGPFEVNGTASFFRIWELLLRAPSSSSQAARARLEAVFDKATAGQDGFIRPLRAFDLALHGKRAIERRGDPPKLFELCYVSDDADYVEDHAPAILAKMRAADREVPDARVVFHGGDKTKAAFVDSDGRWNAVYTARFERQLARLS